VSPLTEITLQLASLVVVVGAFIGLLVWFDRRTKR